MAKISYVNKMQELDAAAASAEKPGLLEALEEALGGRRRHSWIAGMLTNNFGLVRLGFKVTTKDVKGYLMEKWEPPKNRKGQRPASAAPSTALSSSAGAPVGPASAPGSAPAGGVDLLRGIDERVIEGFSQEIDVMIREAIANPTGAAGNMVRVLALTSMVRDRAGFGDIDLMARYAAEVKLKELDIKLKRVEGALRETERKIEEAREARRLKEAEAKQAISKAEKNMQDGMPVDTRLLIEKVSAAIGLRGPLVERVEPGAPSAM